MAPRILPDELLAYLGAPPASQAPLARWLGASLRFAAFADEHRVKIRKKLRSAADAEGVRDVLCELETAYALLHEPRFALAYEAQAHNRARGPDFTVTYRTHTPCHVEVARLRAAALPAGERLHELVSSKLGQTLPGAMNVLVISTSAPLPPPESLAQALKQLQARAERADARLLARYHFDTRAGFFKHHARLSAIVLRSGWDAEAPAPPLLWLNKQARAPLPGQIERALLAVLAPQESSPAS